ncbi:hypothetical protein CBR_g63130 [Chara braunii]|uniref:FAS1 domain-containing protein n=1 Tax=Chara braunii TaxID=69332 RepID=A0A388K910_CHABU|nr:hypothetical protein CBR_g63130 [Chara braunii]|eukprot:GBG66548.1 hypothetical protein CBR_g63130 [Chara braunii]
MASSRLISVFILLSLAMVASEATTYPSEEVVFVNAVTTNPKLTLLTASLKATGLVGPLTELVKAGVTVFAPTDDAFVALGPAVIKCVSKEPGISKVLKPILLYHVVKGKFVAQTLKKKTSLKTVLGPKVSIRKYKQTLKVNKSVVIIADAITSSKSVAHVIDAVLIPKILLPVIKVVCGC